MKRLFFLILVLTAVLCFSACGGNKLPEDWNILSYEEAEKLYHTVDFTTENIYDYLTVTNHTTEIRNDWGELTEIKYTHGLMIEAENFIQFDTPDDDFLMDITITTESYRVKLDPVTLEEIEILGVSADANGITVSTSTSTVNTMQINSFMRNYSYSIAFNTDGSPKLNDNGELIVHKTHITDFKVDRVRGHAEWIADIPQEYIMTTKEYTPHETMGDNDVKFIVIQGKDYYYCYESYNNNNDYQTTGFAIKDSGWFGTGKCISFLRGRE